MLLFFSCVLKINGNLIENAENLDVAMPMYNLLYYSKTNRKTAVSLWNYYRDEPNSGYNNNNRNRIHYSIKDSESFYYKTSIAGKLPDNEDDLENVEFVVLLEYLSNFIWALDILLINCEVCLNLEWSKNCVLTNKATRTEIPAGADPVALPLVPAIDNPTNAEFSITDCKLYVPVVTLSAKYETKLYQQLKEGFTISTYWNKYRC